MTYKNTYYQENKEKWKVYAQTQKLKPDYYQRMREAKRLYRLRHPEKIRVEQKRYSRLHMWRKYYYGKLELQRKRRRLYEERKRRMAGVPLRSELVGPRNHNWKGGPKRCLDCGVQVSRGRATKRCFPCAHRRMRGPNNASWRGGHTSFRKFLYGTTEYRRWRKQVFERDDYICQMCHRQRGGQLEAHHIKRMIVVIREFIPNPYSLPGWKVRDRLMKYQPLWDVSNGITLCKPCHKQESKNDKRIIKQALKNLCQVN